MMQKAVLFGLMSLPMLAQAGNELDSLTDLTQDQFKTFSENLGAATSYKALAPAEPLGITGFDIALELTMTELDDKVFEIASDNDWELNYLPLPKLHLHKGLPFNIDIGGFYSGAPETDIRLWGGEIRYSFAEGGIFSPAIAVRATYSSLEGLDQLDLSNTGVELTISKGFAIITPYAGVGLIHTTSTPIDVAGIEEESFESKKLFAGFNLFMGLNFAFEVDQTGDVVSYSAKTGIRF